MTPNKLPPLPEPPKPRWIAVLTPGADFDITFVATDAEAFDLDPDAPFERLYTIDQMHAYAAEALRQSQSLPAGAVAGLVHAWRAEPEGPFAVFASNREMAVYRECADELEQALQADARENPDDHDLRTTARLLESAIKCHDIAHVQIQGDGGLMWPILQLLQQCQQIVGWARENRRRELADAREKGEACSGCEDLQNELEQAYETVAEDYERDCGKALRGLMKAIGHDWEEPLNAYQQADAIYEHIHNLTIATQPAQASEKDNE